MTNSNCNPETNTDRNSDIDALIQLLDRYNESGGSRLKLQVVEGDGAVVDRQYHHGRCDIGSPWSRGECFDVLKTPEEE